MAPDDDLGGAGRYEFVVRGRLGPRQELEFPELQSSAATGTTTLVGWLPDEAAVHGVLERCRDLRLDLLSMRRLESGPNVA